MRCACESPGRDPNGFIDNADNHLHIRGCFEDEDGSASVGTVYTDEGITSIGANKTVVFSLNGGAATDTDETDAGGQFTLSGATMTGGSIVTLYLDGETEDAVTVVLGSGSAMTGISLFQDRLIVQSESGSAAVTNSTLAVADNNGDADITALYNIDSSAILHVEADKELLG